MKKILFTICLNLLALTGFTSSNPILDFVIFESRNIEVTVEDNMENKDRISVKLFEDILSFKTLDKIKHIQIYNDQKVLIYQIPILSKKLEISKRLFDNGVYQVKFLFYENNEPLDTQIKIKA